MLKVDSPIFWPGHCAITGNREDRDGFIDTGNELIGHPNNDTRIYVSLVGLRQMAKLAGFADPETVEQLVSRIAELESDNEHLMAENEKYASVYGAIEALENAGFQIKTGAEA